jgi:hypothetical protein
MRIIYLNPVEEDTLLSSGRFRRLYQARPLRLIDRPSAAIYETT